MDHIAIKSAAKKRELIKRSAAASRTGKKKPGGPR